MTATAARISVAEIATDHDLIVTDRDAAEMIVPAGFRRISYANGWLTVQSMRCVDGQWIEGRISSARVRKDTPFWVWRDYRRS